MNPQEAKTYLESFINNEHILNTTSKTSFKLSRIKLLLGLIGNPQKNLRIIHVAGSKGKGSTCIFTANMLKDAGYKVGLFTSPHINNYYERIRILDKNSDVESNDNIFPDVISESDFCSTLVEIKGAIEEVKRKKSEGGLSFFEITTALALYYFNKRKVDFVVLEVGLGGRLDATNVIDALVNVITPISLEHTKLLGNTIEEIAGEKAAIIKNKKSKVVIAHQQQNVMDVIEKRCREFSIEPYKASEQIETKLLKQKLEYQMFNVLFRNNITGLSKLTNIKIKLLGKHQMDNVATSLGAIESLRALGYKIEKESIRSGLLSSSWPGRFEIVEKDPNNYFRFSS